MQTHTSRLFSLVLVTIGCIGSARAQAGSVTPFGQGCGPGGDPQLVATAAPHPGNNFVMQLQGVPSAMNSFLLLGARSPNIDLSPIGMTGCRLYASADVVLTLPANGSNTVTYSLPIPAATHLIGLHFYVQGGTFNVEANRAGIITSRGLDAVIGL